MCDLSIHRCIRGFLTEQVITKFSKSLTEQLQSIYARILRMYRLRFVDFVFRTRDKLFCFCFPLQLGMTILDHFALFMHRMCVFCISFF